mmetsp:Transcript_27419/g.85301  ORF Transcript_27419/g.85301 Transcript_27419/m.85301 type:complete len:212 (-) Transcript_27419:126-761(-)
MGVCFSENALKRTLTFLDSGASFTPNNDSASSRPVAPTSSAFLRFRFSRISSRSSAIAMPLDANTFFFAASCAARSADAFSRSAPASGGGFFFVFGGRPAIRSAETSSLSFFFFLGFATPADAASSSSSAAFFAASWRAFSACFTAAASPLAVARAFEPTPQAVASAFSCSWALTASFFACASAFFSFAAATLVFSAFPFGMVCGWALGVC